MSGQNAPHGKGGRLSIAQQSSLSSVDLPADALDPEDSDESLFDGIRLGRRPALRLLMDRHWSGLAGYAAGITNDQDVAQDIVLETFLQIWTKRTDWKPTGAPKAYLYRITRNLALNARRDRALRHRKRREVRPRDLPISSPRTPEEEIEARTLRAEIESAIDTLPERRREIFLLSRFSGLTHREVAETMGISLQTVSNQMSAALAQLRVSLSRHLQD